MEPLPVLLDSACDGAVHLSNSDGFLPGLVKDAHHLLKRYALGEKGHPAAGFENKGNPIPGLEVKSLAHADGYRDLALAGYRSCHSLPIVRHSCRHRQAILAPIGPITGRDRR